MTEDDYTELLGALSNGPGLDTGGLTIADMVKAQEGFKSLRATGERPRPFTFTPIIDMAPPARWHMEMQARRFDWPLGPLSDAAVAMGYALETITAGTARPVAGIWVRDRRQQREARRKRMARKQRRGWA